MLLLVSESLSCKEQNPEAVFFNQALRKIFSYFMAIVLLQNKQNYSP